MCGPCNRPQILDVASRQQEAQAAITVVAEKLLERVCGGIGAVAVVSLPPLADNDDAAHAGGAGGGGVGPTSGLIYREPLIHVATAADATRGSLRSLLSDAVFELQRESIADHVSRKLGAGSPGSMRSLLPCGSFGQTPGSASASALGPFARARASNMSDDALPENTQNLSGLPPGRSLGPAASFAAARIRGSQGNLLQMSSSGYSAYNAAAAGAGAGRPASRTAGPQVSSLGHLWEVSNAEVATLSDEDPGMHMGSFADWRTGTAGSADTAGSKASAVPFMATSCLVGAASDQPLFCLVVQPRGSYRAEVLDIAADLKAVLTDIREREKRMRSEAARRAEEEAGSRQRRFLALMSHELRTPLNAVIALSSLALEEGKLEPAIAEYIQNVTLSGQALQWVITQVRSREADVQALRAIHRASAACCCGAGAHGY